MDESMISAMSSSMESLLGNAKEQKEVLLPDDIWYEILVRLPAESVIRLKRVCKRWRELINSDKFHITHVQHWRRVSAGGTTSKVVITMLSSQPALLSLNFFVGASKDNKYHPYSNPLRFDQFPRTQTLSATADVVTNVLDCYDGLFLVRMSKHLFICNPLTDSYMYLPFPKKSQGYPYLWKIANDPSSTSDQVYVIFCVQSLSNGVNVLSSLRIQLTAGGTARHGLWRQIWSTSYQTGICSFDVSMSINGKVHWLLRRNQSMSTGILTIDAAAAASATADQQLLVTNCSAPPTHCTCNFFVESNCKFYCIKESYPSREELELWAIDDVDHNPTWLKQHVIIVETDLFQRVIRHYRFKGIWKEGNTLIVRIKHTLIDFVYDINLQKWHTLNSIDPQQDFRHSDFRSYSNIDRWYSREFISINYSLLTWTTRYQ